MIKIANIIEDGRMGGPHVRILNVAKSLDESKFETTVVIPQLDSDKYQQKLKDANVKFTLRSMHRLTLVPLHLLAFLIFFIPETLSLWKYFRKESFDIVHVSGGSWQWKGVVAAKLSGAIVLWHLNDTNMPKLICYVMKILSRWCCHGFILAGDSVKSYYLNSLNIKKEFSPIIPAPVDCSYFNPAFKTQPFHDGSRRPW